MIPMKPGDIGLVRISGWVGFLIRLGQWLCGSGFANFEHAFVYVGNSQVVEAQPGGACIAELSKYAGATVRVIPAPTAEIGARVAHEAKLFAIAKVGYSALDYDYIAIRRRLKFLGFLLPFLKGRIATSKRMICSQLADAAADYAGWHLFSDGRWTGDCTPGDLEQLWQALPRPAVLIAAPWPTSFEVAP